MRDYVLVLVYDVLNQTQVKPEDWKFKYVAKNKNSAGFLLSVANQWLQIPNFMLKMQGSGASNFNELDQNSVLSWTF